MNNYRKYFEENLIEPHPMLMLTGGRGTGKTYRMFEYAQEHDYAIFTTSDVRKKSLQLYAEKLGFNVKVITTKDVTGEEKMHVCIDELHDVISQIEKEYNVIIEMCTVLAIPEQRSCSTCVHRNEPWYSDNCDGCCKAHSNWKGIKYDKKN